MTKIDRYRAKHGDLSEIEIFETLLDEKLKRPEAPKRKVQFAAKTSRYLPRSVKYQVYERAKGQCESQNCHERRELEYDHIKPYSYGGKSNLENLQLLCSAHNKRRWIKLKA